MMVNNNDESLVKFVYLQSLYHMIHLDVCPRVADNWKTFVAVDCEKFIKNISPVLYILREGQETFKGFVKCHCNILWNIAKPEKV